MTRFWSVYQALIKCITILYYRLKKWRFQRQVRRQLQTKMPSVEHIKKKIERCHFLSRFSPPSSPYPAILLPFKQKNIIILLISFLYETFLFSNFSLLFFLFFLPQLKLSSSFFLDFLAQLNLFAPNPSLELKEHHIWSIRRT